MTYTPDIPISGESLGSTRDRIRGNFQEIAAVEAINHVAFNTTGKGKHKFLQMPEQLAAPTTLVNEAGFYSKVGTNPAEANLFFRGENNGFEYQLTRADQTNNATFSAVTGWSFLPGGLIMQYGLATSVGEGFPNTTVIFPKSFTNPAYSVTCSIITTANTRQSVNIYDVSNTQFRASTKDAGGSITSGLTFYWVAIGK